MTPTPEITTLVLAAFEVDEPWSSAKDFRLGVDILMDSVALVRALIEIEEQLDVTIDDRAFNDSVPLHGLIEHHFHPNVTM